MVWCSRLLQKEEAGSLVKEKVSILDLSVDLNQDDLCFPSVELLTAQVRPRTSAQRQRGLKPLLSSRTFCPLNCWI